VLAGKTIGAMVSVVTPSTVGNDQTVADLAGETVVARIMAIIVLHIFFSFIFSVQVFFLLKVIAISTFREIFRYLAYANLPA